MPWPPALSFNVIKLATERPRDSTVLRLKDDERCTHFLIKYNPVWTLISCNSGESMPCGGHDIGLNVWVESDATGKGELLFYIDRGSFDENNQMLKLGRVRCADAEPIPAWGALSPGVRLRPP